MTSFANVSLQLPSSSLSTILTPVKDAAQGANKDHCLPPIRETRDSCRCSILTLLEDTKTGTEAIKRAIDKTAATYKAFEKESAGVETKIRNYMEFYMQTIEDRERYLLNKVEKMRQTKLNELIDYTNKLRGIMAGLADTEETLVGSITSEGIDLFAAREKGRAETDNFSRMFKNMYITEDKIIMTPPNYELLEKFKRQSALIVSRIERNIVSIV